MDVFSFPTIIELPDDPEWEETERRIAAHLNEKLPPFEE
jgi:hypothetical protein